MYIPDRTEVIEKLNNIIEGQLSRQEVSAWARLIADAYILHLVPFRDRMVDESFRCLQIADVKISDVNRKHYEFDESYFVRKDDFVFWYDLLKENSISFRTNLLRVSNLHPDSLSKITDFYDFVLEMTADKFIEITGAREHRSFDDLYYQRYILLEVDHVHQYFLSWYMSQHNLAMVYSDWKDSSKSIECLKNAIDYELKVFHQTDHH